MSAGLFTRAGLEITIKRVASGSLGIVALVGNDATVAFANMLSAVVAREKGIPLQALAPAALYDSKTPIARLFAAQSSPIANGKDLGNRTVAITGPARSARTLGESLGRSARRRSDQDSLRGDARPDDVAGLAGRARRRAGGLRTVQLRHRRQRHRPYDAGFPYDAIARQFTVDAWLSLSTWTDANREAARRFAQVIRTAAVYANAHLTEMHPIVATSTGLPEDVIRHALVAKLATDVLPAQLQPLIDTALKFKEIAQPLAAREMIYRS